MFGILEISHRADPDLYEVTGWSLLKSQTNKHTGTCPSHNSKAKQNH